MRRRTFLTGSALMAFDNARLAPAFALLERARDVRAAVLLARQGEFTAVRAFGEAASPETVFLLASITKPMTVAAAMLLVERGQVGLEDPVRRYLPEFRGGDRGRVTVRHLLTHTSGLPDMVPENIELRKRHAPLSEFVAATCRAPLLFAPGTRVRYQSMGILLAAEIVERVARRPLRDFLRDEIFLPLGMRATSLGMGGRRIAGTALCQVPEDTDWNWNSPYWRDLGAPWGGAHATAADVARFLAAFLHPDGRVLKRETARSMVVNQSGLDDPWGFGWMVRPGGFGKACSPRTFGHWGATGTVAWADPATGAICVLLTTRPASQSRDGLLGPVSDAVADAA